MVKWNVHFSSDRHGPSAHRPTASQGHQLGGLSAFNVRQSLHIIGRSGMPLRSIVGLLDGSAGHVMYACRRWGQNIWGIRMNVGCNLCSGVTLHSEKRELR